ncbi:cobalamin biosynthesis protein [Nocardioides seonyuensis]|uniref:Cobalamin biosynthesis protein CobD n=1 Tax=Nocardioides seonyuensis TaxID=2518371 RepID=A0A4P7IJM6_9ACTN|nr:cobalamin biosynthesis protein [Nocardioides seonyuensis]QBX56930.1 cobalamin biosynthesis protein [Nocardioides seonyuensis]
MIRPRGATRAAGLLLGFAADRLLGDPRRGHPVAGFGALAARLERRLYDNSRGRGVLYTSLLVGGCAAFGVGLERGTRGWPVLHAAVTAAATWTVLGGRSLEREALAVHRFLAEGDLDSARHRLTYLVGRDTSSLSPQQIARAVVESVAENTSDAVTAPLVWGAVGGVPGLLAHRASNTLDAMVGYRSERHQNFGWASARLDDLLNLPGSRLAGLAVLVAVPSQARDAWRVWRRDAAGHPSPNGGVVESAFAGALEIVLGGTNRYGERVEHRPTMGDGLPPAPGDIPRATDLATRVGAAAAAVTAVLAAVIGRPSWRWRAGRARPAG